MSEHTAPSSLRAGARSELFLLLDTDHMIVEVSDAFLRATFARGTPIVGCHMFAVFPDNPNVEGANGVRNVRASFDYVVQHRRPHRLDSQRYDVRDRDGAWVERHFASVDTPVFDAGGSNVVQILHEVTDTTHVMQMKAWIEEQLVVTEEHRRSLQCMSRDNRHRTKQLRDAAAQVSAILGAKAVDRAKLQELSDGLCAPSTQTHWKGGAIATVSGVYSRLHGPGCQRSDGQTWVLAGSEFPACPWCDDALAYRLIRRVHAS